VVAFFADNQILITVISGIFSLASAFGTILLKDYLDRKRQKAQSNNIENVNPAQDKPRAEEKTSLNKYSFRRPLGILFITFVIGIFGRLLEEVIESYGAWLTLLLLFILVIVFLLKQKNSNEKDGLLFFQLEMLILWSGYVFGWTLINQGFRPDMIGFIIGCWLVCAFAGGAFLYLSKNKSRKS